jgi:hypothetical protein
MAATDSIRLNEAAITETAQSVVTSLALAAQPGPVPTASGASPIDAAAASVAGAVATNVAASSAQLAPRSAEGLAKSQAALAQMKATDSANAADLKTVPEEMHGTEANRGAAGVQAVSGDPWEDCEDFRDGSEPLPLGPQGAAPGPKVIPGTGIPPELVSHTSGDDEWFYGDDNIDRTVEPGGAGPGPSVIPGTGVPDKLI